MSEQLEPIQYISIFLGLSTKSAKRLLGESWYIESDNYQEQVLCRVNKGVVDVCISLSKGNMFESNQLVIGTAKGLWKSPGHLSFHIDQVYQTVMDVRFLDHMALKEQAANFSKLRFLQIKKCKSCKRKIQPEYFYDTRICSGCASNLFGVVF